MKVLNLDKLAEVERTLTINGVEYPVMEMTVGNFIDTTNAADRLAEEKNPTRQLEETVKLIQRSVPTLPEDVIRAMSFTKMRMVLDFVQGELDTAAKEAVEGTEGKAVG